MTNWEYEKREKYWINSEMGNHQMRDKPCLADYRMITKDRVLLETVMEMVDRFQIIRNGLKDSHWSEIECIPANGAQHFMIYQLREDYWAELIEMAIMYINANPTLCWLGSEEKEYVQKHGLKYTDKDKRTFWRIMSKGVNDYMSALYLWLKEAELE